MKKKVLTLTLLICVLSGGCGKSAETMQDTEEDYTWEDDTEYEAMYSDYEESSDEASDSRQDIIYTPDNTYTGTTEIASGYKAEYTISLTDWFRASDTETVQILWENAGGRDTVPDISSFHEYSNDGFNNENAAVAFGTISFRNITEGFDITKDNPISFSLILSQDNDLHLNGADIKGYVGYSGSPKYLDLGSYDRTISPKMVRNSWGPVPLMLVFPNAFTPNNPDGDPRLNDLKIHIGGNNTDGYISMKLADGDT